MNMNQERQMDPHEWTWRCAEKLHQQWPRVGPGDLVNVAEALQREDRWKGLEPAEAALEWLRQGIPAGHVAGA
ncbi:hypothetical protein [Rhizobacter fulvus]